PPTARFRLIHPPPARAHRRTRSRTPRHRCAPTRHNHHVRRKHIRPHLSLQNWPPEQPTVEKQNSKSKGRHSINDDKRFTLQILDFIEPRVSTQRSPRRRPPAKHTHVK